MNFEPNFVKLTKNLCQIAVENTRNEEVEGGQGLTPGLLGEVRTHNFKEAGGKVC